MFRVLVFPSCNEPGLEVVRALIKSNKIEVIGGSSYDLRFDPSRHLLREHLRCPVLGDAEFRADFERLLRQHRIDTVFPTTDALVAEFAQWRLPDVTMITTDERSAAISLSKVRTYSVLSAVVPVPEIYARHTVVVPAYAKPDVGAGSQGHRIVRDIDELEIAERDGLLVMELLPGEEFTVDCVSDLTGKILYVGPRSRNVVGRCIALGMTEAREDGLIEHIERIAETLRIRGPWFAQFKRDRQGVPKLLEVNSRVGGSMTYARLCGVNIPQICVFMFKGLAIRVPQPTAGLILNRCLVNLADAPEFDAVIWDLDDTLVRADGRPDPEAMACLFDCHNRSKRQFLVTKNPRVLEVIDELRLPSIFEEVVYVEDKVPALAALFDRCGLDWRKCICVNDSNSEKLMLQAEFAGIRVVTPDALEVLGRERL